MKIYMNEDPLQNQLMAERSKTRENRVEMLRKIDIVFHSQTEILLLSFYFVKYFYFNFGTKKGKKLVANIQKNEKITRDFIYRQNSYEKAIK